MNCNCINNSSSRRRKRPLRGETLATFMMAHHQDQNHLHVGLHRHSATLSNTNPIDKRGGGSVRMVSMDGNDSSSSTTTPPRRPPATGGNTAADQQEQAAAAAAHDYDDDYSNEIPQLPPYNDDYSAVAMRSSSQSAQQASAAYDERMSSIVSVGGALDLLSDAMTMLQERQDYEQAAEDDNEQCPPTAATAEESSFAVVQYANIPPGHLSHGAHVLGDATTNDTLPDPSAARHDRDNSLSPVQQHSLLTPPPQTAPGTIIRNVHTMDVLSGRGGAVNAHRGNVLYRKLVAANRELYRAVPKRQRVLLSKSIVYTLQKHGCRFLGASAEAPHELWAMIATEQAIQKTSQALREKHTVAELHDGDKGGKTDGAAKRQKIAAVEEAEKPVADKTATAARNSATTPVAGAHHPAASAP